MKVLRTPIERFKDLPDYDFEPHYTIIPDNDGTDLCMHSIDVGPRDADPILLIHGNPTWSYMFRHMIKGLMVTGKRIIAVDLIGHGKSDKPAKRKYYTLERHKEWLIKWLLLNDLHNITLFCHDWGATLGLHLVGKLPNRFDRVAICNSTIPTGIEGEKSKVLRRWLWLMKFFISFPWKFAFLGSFKERKKLTPEEFKAYKAPYPNFRYQAGIVKFPQLITIYPEHPEVSSNLASWDLLCQFDKPVITFFGEKDPVAKLMDADTRLQENVPGCKGQDHQVFSKVGHFAPEEIPDELVHHLIKFMNSTK